MVTKLKNDEKICYDKKMKKLKKIFLHEKGIWTFI